MSTEFLKEYLLYQDIMRLNNDEYYHGTFSTEDTIQLFSSVLSFEDYRNRGNIFKVFLYNLKHTKGKSVYLLMKWLVTCHKIIQVVNLLKLLEDIFTTLGQIQKPNSNNSFEGYFYDKLVKPYTNYLQKYCLFLIRKHSLTAIKTQLYQIIPQQEIQLWYIEYNMLRFGSKQFITSLRQFTGFLKKCYPFLSIYINLIRTDLKSSYKRIKAAYKKQIVSNISYIELQFFSELLDNFSLEDSEQIDSDNFTHFDLNTSKLYNFFNSDTKKQAIEATSNSIQST